MNYRHDSHPSRKLGTRNVGRNTLLTDPNPSLIPFTTIVIAVISILFGGSHIAQAAITPSGDVNPIHPGADPWIVGDHLYIGDTAVGELRIDNASRVENDRGIIGFNEGAAGAVTVSGVGSVWDNNEKVWVGWNGRGDLQIDSGGVVNSDYVFINGDSNGTSTVTIDGPGSTWNHTGQFSVAHATTGTLLLTNGGTINGPSGMVGYWHDAVGTATVRGAGSVWNNSDQFYVGFVGDGTLYIEDGGVVQATNDTWLGSSDISSGVIHFDQGTLNTGALMAPVDGLQGTGTINTTGLISDMNVVFDTTHGLQQQIILTSLPDQNVTINLDASDPLNTGRFGAGYRDTGSLTIADGRVLTSSSGYLGYHDGAHGNATVTGAGSAWNNDDKLHVGYWGTGELRIENGGFVSNSTGYVGFAVGTSGSAVVNGVGSVWQNNEGLRVGSSGDGSLRIEDGGVVNSSIGGIGGGTDTTGSVTVTGTGSIWNSGTNLSVGSSGTGTLIIEDGGEVNSGSGYVGHSDDSSGTATVTGAGSVWHMTSPLTVGDHGAGTLMIVDGGVVNTTEVRIGYRDDSSGAVTVDGPTSELNITNGDLEIAIGGQASLHILNGAVVDVPGETGVSAFPTPGTGTIQFNNGTLNTNGLVAAGESLLGTGTINTTGLFTDMDMIFDATHGLQQQFVLNSQPGQNITVNLDASGPNTTSIFGAGFAGTGSLTIADGRALSSGKAFIGYQATANGTVTVTGSNSVWDIDGTIYIGLRGTGTLNIENGGQVYNNNSYISDLNTSGMVNVRGEGSQWHNHGNLHVGRHSPGVLNIEQGATVHAYSNVSIGNSSGTQGILNLIDGTLDLHGSGLYSGSGFAQFNFTGGTLNNPGTIVFEQGFVQAGGKLVVGDPIGVTHIDSSYVMSAGTLEINFGGPGQTLDMIEAYHVIYDWYLNPMGITPGQVSINPIGTTLELSPLGPMQAGTYTIIDTTGGAVTGMFEHVVGIGLYPGLVDVLYSPSTVSIRLNWDYFPGDLDGDGFVGIDDLNTVLAAWNQSVTPYDLSSGDITGDGYIGIDDLTAVLANWNTGTPPPPEASTTIPEPASLGLLSLGVMWGSARRRSRLAVS